MTQAFKIDPVERTLAPACFTWPSGPSPASWFGAQHYVPPDIMKHAARADNVPLKHFYVAARLLGASSPLHVAPYKVNDSSGVRGRGIRGIRTFVWVMDNVEPERKLDMHGFTLGSHPGKWVGVGFVVEYDPQRNLQPVGSTMASVRWMGPGAGVVDTFVQLEVVPAPTECANPACANTPKEKTTAGLMRCSRCMRVAYCSKECQTAHWQVHKCNARMAM